MSSVQRRGAFAAGCPFSSEAAIRSLMHRAVADTPVDERVLEEIDARVLDEIEHPSLSGSL